MKSKNNRSVFGFKTTKFSRQEEEKSKKIFFKKELNKYPKIQKTRKVNPRNVSYLRMPLRIIIKIIAIIDGENINKSFIFGEGKINNFDKK